jgi:hypothetical protein
LEELDNIGELFKPEIASPARHKKHIQLELDRNHILTPGDQSKEYRP